MYFVEFGVYICISFFSDKDLDLNAAFPTDRGKFPETINNAHLKIKIILFGPCKPNIKFPEN